MKHIYIVKETVTDPSGDYLTDTLYTTYCQSKKLAKAAFEKRKSEYTEMAKQGEIVIEFDASDEIGYRYPKDNYRYYLFYGKVNVATAESELNDATD